MRPIIIAVANSIYRTGIAQELRSQNWRATDNIVNRHQLTKNLTPINPCIIILCVDFAGANTRQLLRAIYKESPQSKVLLWCHQFACALDYFTGDEKLAGFLYQQVDGYELVKAVTTVQLGQFHAPALLQALFRRYRNAINTDVLNGLSRRERQVLQMICSGMAVAEIAERLFVSRKTVNTFRYRLFRKLGVNGDVQLAHLAIGYGVVPIIPVATEQPQLAGA